MPSHRGQWQRVTDDGPVTIPCPMKVTWDAALQIREAVKRHLGRKVFVVAVLMFPGHGAGHLTSSSAQRTTGSRSCSAPIIWWSAW